MLRKRWRGEEAGSGKVLPRPQFLSAGSLNESYEDESGLARRGWVRRSQREEKNGERGEARVLNSHRPRRIHLQATLWPYHRPVDRFRPDNACSWYARNRSLGKDDRWPAFSSFRGGDREIVLSRKRNLISDRRLEWTRV